MFFGCKAQFIRFNQKIKIFFKFIFTNDLKFFIYRGILLRGVKMKVFYLLFLSGLLAVPAYAEDDVLSMAAESVSVAAEEVAEDAEAAANEVGKAVNIAEEKVDLLEATATPEEDTAVDAAEEKVDLLETTATPEEDTVVDTAQEKADLLQEAETSEEDTAVEVAQEKVDLLKATETSEETTAAEEKASEALPEDFKEKLYACTPAATSRNVNNQVENIEIRGADDENCKIRFVIFDLSIPMSDLTQIGTYEDFEKLCKNPEISTLAYTDRYNYANLMSELNQCKGYQFLHHNGRATTEYPAVNVTVITDMTAQLKEDVCELTFVNEITVDNKFMNYTVVCKVPEEKIAGLLESYHDLIDLYGAKEIVNEDGSVSSRTAVSNEKTRHIDAKLMYELQTAGYCGLLETKE